MTKWIMLRHSCPECKEGSIFAVKNKRNNELYAYCEECDTLWRTPEDIDIKNYMDEQSVRDESEWGGYASIEEVEAFGWKKYVK